MYTYIINLIGSGYDQSVESDILLLDISNNDEYVWTNDFIPSPSSTPPTSTQSPSPTLNGNNSPNPSNLGAIVGGVVGSLFGIVLLSFGCFFLYKRNKNKQKRKNTLLISGSDNQITESNITRQNNHESIIIPAPVINNKNGQEILTTNNDKNIALQDMDSDVIKHLKDEVLHSLIQGYQNNSGQGSNSSNIARNNKY
jgi:hypothetical protein